MVANDPVEERICPRCGHAASGLVWCDECGSDLREVDPQSEAAHTEELREEHWLAGQGHASGSRYSAGKPLGTGRRPVVPQTTRVLAWFSLLFFLNALAWFLADLLGGEGLLPIWLGFFVTSVVVLATSAVTLRVELSRAAKRH